MSSKDEKFYCIKPECIHTASRILEYMDITYDPCENFYKFACGQYDNSRTTRAYKTIDQISMIEKEIFKEMQNYLQKEISPTEPRYAKLIKTFYNSCIDGFYNLEKINLNRVGDLVNKIGGWPFINGESWTDENFQWEKFGSQDENITILENYFISINFREDTINSQYKVLVIEQPSKFFTFPDDYPKIFKTVEWFKVNIDEDIEKDLIQFLEVDKKLFNITVEKKDININPYERMTVKQLMEKYSNILWKELFNTFLKPNTISDDDVILVDDIGYFNKFNELIKNISKSDQANYLIYRAIYTILEDFIISTDVEDKEGICYESIDNIFHESLGALYFRNVFNRSSSLKNVDEMVDNIYDQFNSILRKSQWMENGTKLRALEKLRSMFIVRPTQYLLRDDNEIDEYYKDLEITPGDYLQSLINITKFQVYKQNVEVFRRPVNKGSWTEILSAKTVNANNVHPQNKIVVSPAYLQGDIFNANRPQYMNYGAIGSVIGHEFTHAFDNQGRKYDEAGNLINWWEPKSDGKFLDKAQCIIDQYNNFTVEEISLNIKGNKTQNENIADNEGIKVAYLAYEKYMKTHGLEPLLPGVNYTQRQLFWISFAQLWCAKKTPDELKDLIENDEHALHKFRIIGSLINSRRFARDFQCAPGTRMNPKKKCHFW
ncbi:neprilysin-2-like isoform X2 [Leptopilina heterotoma]|nr:neprilysin-2-like isoform X2 [Leptopilina heterotoma]